MISRCTFLGLTSLTLDGAQLSVSAVNIVIFPILLPYVLPGAASDSNPRMSPDLVLPSSILDSTRISPNPPQSADFFLMPQHPFKLATFNVQT